MNDAEQKIELIKSTLRTWIGQQGHDRCWYYPDIFKKLMAIVEIDVVNEPSLPPLEEFKKGCERYQSEEYLNNAQKQ